MKTSRALQVFLITISCLLRITSSSNCPMGWEMFNNQKCIRIMENATNAFDAADVCTRVGGSQWVFDAPNTEMEEEFVWDLWKLTSPRNQFVFLWVGISLNDETGYYEWANGSPAKDTVNTNLVCPSGEICPVKILRRDMPDSLICSFECDKQEVYPVCEKLLFQPSTTEAPAVKLSEEIAVIVISGSTSTTTAPKTAATTTTETTERPKVKLEPSPLCGPGWNLFESRCYHLTPNPVKGGADARMACSMRGGDVVSVTSLEQQQFFEAVVFDQDHGLAGEHYEGPAFLGARKVRDNFIWDRGQPFNFTHWADGEPQKDGNCIIISRLGPFKGKWRTISCNHICRVLCGKPTLLGVTTAVPTSTSFSDSITNYAPDKETISEDYIDAPKEEIMQDMKSPESNAEQSSSPVQNASLMISVVVIALVAILFLICFVLRIRRKAREKNREKLHLEQSNGDSKTYVSKP